MSRRIVGALGAAAAALLEGCLESTAPEPSVPASISAHSASVAGGAVCLEGTALPRVGALASSQESPVLGAANAIDGNASTRWSSRFADNQWLRLDLGAVRYIASVSLSWEAASAARYDIQVSDDGVNWKGVKAVNGLPGPTTLTLSGLGGKGRYVRMYAYTRSTPYGVSLFEMTASGDMDGSCVPSSVVRVDNVHSGKSMDVAEWSTQNGGRIHQWTWTGGNNQRWYFWNKGGDVYEIRSRHSGKCLDVSAWSTQNGAAIHQWNCTDGANQRWRLRPAEGNAVLLESVHSGKCVDVGGWSTANGGRLIQWDCHGGANQRWLLKNPMDLRTDPQNCGRPGKSCLGGACDEGVCKAAVVASDFSCATSMAADESHLYVGDAGNLMRYDLTGYNRTTVLGGSTTYISELVRDGSQFFWASGSGLQRWSPGQSSAATLYGASAGQISVTGSTVVAMDWQNARFVSMDRNLSAPGAFSVVHNLGAEHSMYSAATAAHFYYVHGSPSGSVVYQVDRATGARRAVNSAESVFGIVAFGETVYWNYRESSGLSGIRSLSSSPGAAVQEAVEPAGGAGGTGGVGSPAVDASGIYYSRYDGTTNDYVRTPHGQPARRDLVTRNGTYPYQGNLVRFTANSLFWLSPCSRGGPGTLWRLAKP